MKKLLSLFFCLILSCEMVFADAIKLKKNTSFKISMQSTIDSHSAKKNSIIAASLTEDLVQDNEIIAPKGSIVYGEITKVRQNVSFCADGLVGFRFSEIVTPDNKSIKITCKDFVFATTEEENNLLCFIVPQVSCCVFALGAVAQAVGLIYLPIMILDCAMNIDSQRSRDDLREYSKLALGGVILVPLSLLKNKGYGSPVIIQAGTPLTVVAG